MAGGWWRGGAGRRRRRAMVAGALVVVTSAALPATALGPSMGGWGPGRGAQPEGRGLDRQGGTTSGPSRSTGGDHSPGATPAGAPGATCEPGPTTPDDRFDPFYGQVCWTAGIPVVASADVEPAALAAAARIVEGVLGPRPDLRELLERRGMKVAVLGRSERAVELPEYRDLPQRYPDQDWEAARAYSATGARPLLTAPEENLACTAADTYPGQQVLVHELGHSVLDLAVRPSGPGFWERVERAHDEALRTGRWVGYYGATSPAEYWAEGVQAYFDAGARSPAPDPYGTPAASREQLAAYDPALHGLVREVFGDNPWRAPRCP